MTTNTEPDARAEQIAGLEKVIKKECPYIFPEQRRELAEAIADWLAGGPIKGDRRAR